MPVTFDSWVDKSDVVFVIEVGSNLLSNFNESGKGQFVAQVGVEVVLVMLKFIHILDGVVVVSYFWERERFVIELFSCYGPLWFLSLFLETFFDFHGVLPVLHFEVSGEFSKLIMKTVFTDFKRRWAILFLQLHEFIKFLLIIRDNCLGAAYHEESKDCIFHILTDYIIILLINKLKQKMH